MTTSATDVLRLSTVTPVYAGEAYLASLVDELERLRDALAAETVNVELMEAILVLDEPVDGSRGIARKLAEEKPWIRLVELSRNFGQHSATVAGVLHSAGDWVVTLDEDLQHRPALIPEMLAAVGRAHGDVLYVVPTSGPHGSAFRDLASRIAKRGIGWLSGNRHVSEFSSFRLIRGQVARAAASACSKETYFDMALLWFTDRIDTLPKALEDPRFRETQNSGYSLLSLLQHAKRLLFSSDVHFFRLAVLVSGLSFLLAVVLLAWVLLSYTLSPEDVTTEGWASLMSVNLFFGGTVAMLLGLVLEFVRAGAFHGQGKPSFFVVNRDDDVLLERHADALAALADRLEPKDSESPGNHG